MAGRPRLPTRLKVVKGTAQPCRTNKSEPTPAEGVPSRPAHVSAKAKAAWRAVGPILQDMRVLPVADSLTLGALCEAVAGRSAGATEGARSGGPEWGRRWPRFPRRRAAASGTAGGLGAQRLRRRFLGQIRRRCHGVFDPGRWAGALLRDDRERFRRRGDGLGLEVRRPRDLGRPRWPTPRADHRRLRLVLVRVGGVLPRDRRLGRFGGLRGPLLLDATGLEDHRPVCRPIKLVGQRLISPQATAGYCHWNRPGGGPTLWSHPPAQPSENRTRMS